MTSIRPYFELKIPAPKYGAEPFTLLPLYYCYCCWLDLRLVPSGVNISWSGHVYWIIRKQRRNILSIIIAWEGGAVSL
jgi:hypothetical protein